MTDRQLELLHRLRVVGPTKIEALSEGEGADSEIQELIDSGLLLEAAGHVALTEQGSAADAERLAESLDSDASARMAELYDGDFLSLNREFKSLCAEWQREERFELVEQAALVHERLTGGFLDQVVPGAPHLGAYGPRFERAMELFLDGDGSALTAATADSYHGVWFELHEDLIVTLGRSRADEEAGEARQVEGSGGG